MSASQQTGGAIQGTRGVPTTPIRGVDRHNTSSHSRARATTGTIQYLGRKDMSGPIRVDLAGAQDCKATDLIKFLFAFCQSGDDKNVPACDDELLELAFREVKKVANQERTPLRDNLNKFLKAKSEAGMYKPFVAACNYALHKFSDLQVRGLPRFSEEKQIVFVRNHDRSVRSQDPMRESRLRPDIVVLSWALFNESQKKKARYSTSYTTDISLKNSDMKLSWDKVQTTVEMKFTGSMKRNSWRTFDTEFGALVESRPYTSLDDKPDNNNATQHSERPAEKGDPVVDAPASTSSVRKSDVLLHENNREEPAPKRQKTESSEIPTQSGEHSGKGVSGSSQPPPIPEKHAVNVQNAMYAAERLSCSPEITHSINFILRGTTIYITWSDRQSVIRTAGFNIINDLPHFLLILLILQRFDLARWGLFTAFEGSEIHRALDYPDPGSYVLKATFIPGGAINIFPYGDPVHNGFNLVGRSTTAAGARKAADDVPSSSQDIQNAADQVPSSSQDIQNAAEEVPSSSQDFRNGNNIIVKFSWPEETRASEVDVIQKAKRIGETNELVQGHLPKVLGNIDPPYLTCSTSIIRTFLGLATAGARVLRVIAFPRLKELMYLDEEDMLMAFLDCFLCHWVLWCEGIQHGDISIGNLMYNPVTKRGVLNDFDLARIRIQGEDGKPTGKDNTGTMPFMALDLLSLEGLQGMVPRLYRHDAESFAWCLIYICICMQKRDGAILVQSPHPLRLWFENWRACHHSKMWETGTLLEKTTLHERSKPLAINLFNHWVDRFQKQRDAKRPDADVPTTPKKRLRAGLFAGPKYNVPGRGAYEELPERESFRQVCQLLLGRMDVVPDSKIDLFVEKMERVAEIYEF